LYETDVFSFNIDGYMPVGALGTAVAAAAGPTFVAWRLGVRPGGKLIVSLLALMTGAYFLAHYGGYLAVIAVIERKLGIRLHVSFWRYFHASTMTMSFSSVHSGKPGTPLKEVGYLVRAAEFIAFVGVGIGLPALLRLKAYCLVCQRYMRTRTLARLPIEVIPWEVLTEMFDVDKGERGRKRVAETGVTGELRRHAETGDAAGFEAALRPLAMTEREGKKRSPRLDLKIDFCPQCRAGHFEMAAVTRKGSQTSSARVFRVVVPQAFVREVLGLDPPAAMTTPVR
jgi:hypothetical protein